MFGCVPRFFVLSTLPGSNGLLLPWPCPRWQQGRDREMMHGRETMSHPQRRTRSGGTMRKSCLGWSVVTAALTLLTVGPGLTLSPDELSRADQGHLGEHPRAPAGDRGNSPGGQVRLQADAFGAGAPGDPHPLDRGELLLLYQGIRGSAAERRPSQGAQDPRRDPEGASRELRLRREGMGHAHRGQGPGAGRGPEQAAGAALVVHPWRDPGQYEPLR